MALEAGISRQLILAGCLYQVGAFDSVHQLNRRLSVLYILKRREAHVGADNIPKNMLGPICKGMVKLNSSTCPCCIKAALKLRELCLVISISSSTFV